MTEIVVVSGVRTAIGSYGGSLRDVPASELATLVVREALCRANLRPEDVDHVVFGMVNPTAKEDPYIARVAAVKAGIPVRTPAVTVNRLCGSGLEAITSGARLILAGDADVVVAGGVESMSRAPYWSMKTRWGARMGDETLLDSVLAGLSDPFDNVHMGITAENVAEKYAVSRQRQDEYALLSQQRAARAIREGRFRSQIVPVAVPDRKGGPTLFEVDEHPRPETNLEKLAALKPAFKPDGTVTAGNASGLNDGASAVVLMSRERAEQLGVPPLAQLLSWAVTGCRPEYMGIGPVTAVPKALMRAGLRLSDIDLIEFNEAFAAQVLAVVDELQLDLDKVNPNGGAIALGHPIGATGTILTVKLLYELQRADQELGLVTLCIGGGQGIAAVFRRER
ncbi:MAG: beta-ketothiolase BktB [Chloroflexota bacterium]|nr:beta-ketothiolase BktB [Dehalococcoidia bacterium]MDW8252569.1 beta-ketothiolase BktB [Chloroflexota bacterium]